MFGILWRGRCLGYDGGIGVWDMVEGVGVWDIVEG